MIRRLNYTGRKRITRDRVSITLTKREDGLWFDANTDLRKMELTDTAMVVLEAYHIGDVRRFDLGTAARGTVSGTGSLKEFSDYQSIGFRLLVMDTSRVHGRILAIADRLKPNAGDKGPPYEGQNPLLPVDFVADMKEMWRINFDDPGRPVLEVNKTIPRIREMILDAEIRLAILPAVFREILNQMLIIDHYTPEDESDEEESDDWSDWWAFTTSIQGYDDAMSDSNPRTWTDDDRTSIVEAIVENFCDQERFLRSFLTDLRED